MNPGARLEAFERARLYLCAPGEFPVDVLQSVIEAGVDIVQLRMKDADDAEIIEIGDAFRGVCERAGVPFVLNDRPDLAHALGADGVHLGQDDLAPALARDIVGPNVMIGRSTHSTADIERGLREHADGVADYIAVGPVHETPTGPGKPAVGIGLVRFAAEQIRIPWFAIGGLNVGNLDEVAGAGATRVAVVRAITEAADPVGAAERLRAALA